MYENVCNVSHSNNKRTLKEIGWLPAINALIEMFYIYYVNEHRYCFVFQFFILSQNQLIFLKKKKSNLLRTLPSSRRILVRVFLSVNFLTLIIYII